MKTIFKVFGLQEREITIDSWLTASGIEAEKEMVTFRVHLDNFDTEFDAFKFIDESKEQFEHGFEVIRVIKK